VVSLQQQNRRQTQDQHDHLHSNLPPLFHTPLTYNTGNKYSPSSRHAWHRYQRQFSLAAKTTSTTDSTVTSSPTPISSSFQAQPQHQQQNLPSLTWISYWEDREDRRRFLQEAKQALRGRQFKRRQQLSRLLLDDDDDPNNKTASTALPATTTTGPLIDNNNNNKYIDEEDDDYDDIMDDLTWMASHPDSPSPSPSPSSISNSNTITTNNSNGNSRQEEWSVSSTAAPTIDMRLAGTEESIPVRPLWISIYKDTQLYDSPQPLSSELLSRLSPDTVITPFATISGYTFSPHQADIITSDDDEKEEENDDDDDKKNKNKNDNNDRANWKSYFVGLVGGVAVEEDEILWPNQVLHRDRVLFNVRSGEDVARFLADPRIEDVEGHVENLVRLAEERGYRKRWCWYMLRARWGEGTLKRFGYSPEKF
jgi:hypothetical protein